MFLEVGDVGRYHAEYEATGVDHLPELASIDAAQPARTEVLQALHLDVVGVNVEMSPRLRAVAPYWSSMSSSPLNTPSDRYG